MHSWKRGEPIESISFPFWQTYYRRGGCYVNIVCVCASLPNGSNGSLYVHLCLPVSLSLCLVELWKLLDSYFCFRPHYLWALYADVPNKVSLQSAPSVCVCVCVSVRSIFPVLNCIEVVAFVCVCLCCLSVYALLLACLLHFTLACFLLYHANFVAAACYCLLS